MIAREKRDRFDDEPVIQALQFFANKRTGCS
jgi:hypothetical protein